MSKDTGPVIRAAASCLFIVFLLVFGCVRKEDSAAAAAGPARNQPQMGSPRPRTPGRPPQPSANGSPAEPRVYAGHDDPLFGLPLLAALPGDFTLGLLHDPSAVDASGREVYALIAAFFNAVNAGKAARDYFHPDYRFFLERSLDGARDEEEKQRGRLQSTIAEFRVGEIHFSGDRSVAQADVLIMGAGRARGRTRGELIAEKKGERWYIAGLAVDFAGLFSPEEKSTEAFDPGPSLEILF